MKFAVKAIFTFAIIMAIVAQIFTLASGVVLLMFSFAETVPYVSGELLAKLLSVFCIALLLNFVGVKVVGAAGSLGQGMSLTNPLSSLRVFGKGLGKGGGRLMSGAKSAFKNRSKVLGDKGLRGLFGKDPTSRKNLMKEMLSTDPRTMMRNQRIANRLRSRGLTGKGLGSYELSQVLRGANSGEANDGSVFEEDEKEEKPKDIKDQKSDKEKSKEDFDKKNATASDAEKEEGVPAHQNGSPHGSNINNDNTVVVGDGESVVASNGDKIPVEEAYDKYGNLNPEYANRGLPDKRLGLNDAVNASSMEPVPANLKGDTEKAKRMVEDQAEGSPELSEEQAHASAKKRAEKGRRAAEEHPGMPEESYTDDINEKRAESAEKARRDRQQDWESLLSEGDGSTEIVTTTAAALMAGRTMYGYTAPDDKIIDESVIDKMRDVNHPLVQEFEDQGHRALANNVMEEYVAGMSLTSPAKGDSEEELEDKAQYRKEILDGLVDQHGNHVGDQIAESLNSDEEGVRIPLLLAGGEDGNTPVVFTDDNGKVVFHDDENLQGVLHDEVDTMLDSVVSTQDERRPDSSGMPEESAQTQTEPGASIKDVLSPENDNTHEAETVSSVPQRSTENNVQQRSAPVDNDQPVDNRNDDLVQQTYDNLAQQRNQVEDNRDRANADTGTQNTSASSSPRDISQESTNRLLDSILGDGDSMAKGAVLSALIHEAFGDDKVQASIDQNSMRRLEDTLKKSIDSGVSDLRSINEASDRIAQDMSNDDAALREDIKRFINIASSKMLASQLERDNDKEDETINIEVNDGSVSGTMKPVNRDGRRTMRMEDE